MHFQITKNLPFGIPDAPGLEIRLHLTDWSKRYHEATALVPPDRDEIVIEMKLNPDWRPTPRVILRAPERLPEGFNSNYKLRIWPEEGVWENGLRDLPSGGKGILLPRVSPGRHHLIVSGSPTSRPDPVYCWEAELSFPEQGTVTHDMTFVAGRRIFVSVATEAGPPPKPKNPLDPALHGYSVWPDGTEGSGLSFLFNEEGHCAGPYVPYGRCRLVVDCESYLPESIEVEPGTTEVHRKVVLRPKPKD